MCNNTVYGAFHKTSWKGITLTNSAAQHILELTQKDPNILGLKITIKKSGCAGLSYKMNKMIVMEDNVIMYERDGAKLFVPLDIMPIIDGTELDYVQEGLNYLFKFNNPQVQYSCGCGSSFGI